MNYDLCSLIINTIIAFSASVGIILSICSYKQSNKHVQEQMNLQQQPYIKIVERRNPISQIYIRNIGTGPALSIFKLVRQMEAKTDILNNLDNIPPKYIGTLGVGEEYLTSTKPIFTPSDYPSDYDLIRSGKDIVWIEAYVFSDSFNNIYVAECEITQNGISFDYNFNFAQRKLNSDQAKRIKTKLKLCK